MGSTLFLTSGNIGCGLVAWLLKEQKAPCREAAVLIGRRLIELEVLQPLATIKGHKLAFKDAYCPYSVHVCAAVRGAACSHS